MGKKTDRQLRFSVNFKKIFSQDSKDVIGQKSISGQYENIRRFFLRMICRILCRITRPQSASAVFDSQLSDIFLKGETDEQNRTY